MTVTGVFCYNPNMRNGQALLEYVLSLAGMLVVSAILWGLVSAAVSYAERTESLVVQDTP